MCLSIKTKYKHIFYTLFFTLCETKYSTFNVKVPLYIIMVFISNFIFNRINHSSKFGRNLWVSLPVHFTPLGYKEGDGYSRPGFLSSTFSITCLELLYLERCHLLLRNIVGHFSESTDFSVMWLFGIGSCDFEL